MTRPHEFGTRDPGMCEILPPPTRTQQIEAAIALQRQWMRDAAGEIRDAQRIIEEQRNRISRSSDSFDRCERAIEQREAELAALQEAAE